MDKKWLDQAEKLAMRPYYIKVTLDETTEDEPIYLAHVLELDGCFGYGEDIPTAISDLRDAMVDYIASLLEDGLSVPEPAQLAMTTSSTTSKTFTFPNYPTEKINIANPHRNIFVPVE